MIKPDQIPDAVVEAALPFAASCAYYCKPSANDCQCRQNTHRAIAAAINAWPGVSVHNFDGYEYPEGIVLPLPEAERIAKQEESDNG